MMRGLLTDALSGPKPGEVLFVRVLEKKHASQLLTAKYNVSQDDSVGSVAHMLSSLGLVSMATRPFACIYAFTASTWKHFPKKLAMTEGLNVAIVLDHKKLADKGLLWIFNGDVQSLAAKEQDRWWCRKHDGNMSELAADI